MFEEFNKAYGLPQGTEFKFIELWKALLDEFRSIGFTKWESYKSDYDGTEYPGGYTCGVDFEWETYNFSIMDAQPTCYEALCQLFLKFKDTSYHTYEEHPTDKFHKVVKQVYKS